MMYDNILKIIAGAVENDAADLDSSARLFALAIINEEKCSRTA